MPSRSAHNRSSALAPQLLHPAWHCVTATLPLSHLAALACTSRAFAALSQSLFSAAVAAALPLHSRAHPPGRQLAGLLAAAPLLSRLYLHGTAECPLDDAVAAALAGLMPPPPRRGVAALARALLPPAASLWPASLTSLAIAPSCEGAVALTGAGVAALLSSGAALRDLRIQGARLPEDVLSKTNR